MKNIYKYSLALAFAVTIASCDDTQFEMDKPSASTGKEIRVSASLGNDTRVGVSENEYGLDFVWQDGDYFTVLTSDQTTQFNLVEGAGTRNGEFSGTPSRDYDDQEDLLAVIANQEFCNVNTRDENGNLLISIPTRQSGLLDGKYQMMYATSQYQENDYAPLQLRFNHLVSVFKPNLVLPDGVSSIDSIAMLVSAATNKTTLLVKPMSIDDNEFSAGVRLMDADSATFREFVVDHIEINDNVASSYIYFLPSWFYWKSRYDENGYLIGGGHSGEFSMSPVFLAYSGDNMYVSQTLDNNNVPQPGYLYELKTWLSDLVTLNLGENDDLSDDGMCMFVPDTDGYYSFEGNYDIFTNWVHYYYGYYFKAGEKVIIKSYDSSITVKKLPNVTVDEQIPEFGFYVFVPEESGYYTIENGYFSVDGASQFVDNVYELEAGKRYVLNVHGGNTSKVMYLRKTDFPSVSVNDEFTKPGYYTFTPEETGFYSIADADFYFINQERYLASMYELEAGNIYYIRIYSLYSDSAVLKKVETLSAGDELASLGYYSFTPEESGYYSFYPYYEVDWFGLEWGTEQIGPHAKLEAGKTYFVRYSSNNHGANPILRHLPVYSMSEEITLTDKLFVLQITPTESGWYTLSGDHFDSQWFSDKNPYNICNYLEAGETYTKVVYSYIDEESQEATRYFIERYLDNECSVNETVTVDEQTLYRFTPSETGWYQIDCNNSNYRVEADDSQKLTNTSSGRSYHLFAGEEYRVRVLPFGNTYLTIRPLQPEKLSLELDVEYIVNPGEFKSFQFIAPEYGEYVIERLSGDWIGFVRCENNNIYNFGENVWANEGTLHEIPVDVPDDWDHGITFKVVKRQ